MLLILDRIWSQLTFTVGLCPGENYLQAVHGNCIGNIKSQLSVKYDTSPPNT